MNLVAMIGRLTADPEIRYTGELAIAKYQIAVDRRFKKDGQPSADFFRVVVFGKGAEFAEKYLKKGTKIAINGRLQSSSYDRQDGTKAYVTEIVADSQEFVEKKSDTVTEAKKEEEVFMTVDGIQEELPFT